MKGGTVVVIRTEIDGSPMLCVKPGIVKTGVALVPEAAPGRCGTVKPSACVLEDVLIVVVLP